MKLFFKIWSTPFWYSLFASNVSKNWTQTWVKTDYLCTIRVFFPTVYWHRPGASTVLSLLTIKNFQKIEEIWRNKYAKVWPKFRQNALLRNNIGFPKIQPYQNFLFMMTYSNFSSSCNKYSMPWAQIWINMTYSPQTWIYSKDLHTSVWYTLAVSVPSQFLKHLKGKLWKTKIPKCGRKFE